MAEDIRPIVDAIHAAFGGASRVERGAITLHEAERIDSYGTSGERTRARRVDTEASWTEIPDEHIEECANALPHLDPASWRYYLPRFMEWALQQLASGRRASVDHVLYTLVLGDDRALNDHARRRYAALTPEQSAAVCAFLAYAAKHERCDAEAAATALTKYWQKFGA